MFVIILFLALLVLARWLSAVRGVHFEDTGNENRSVILA
jgi:hypothetical protein